MANRASRLPGRLLQQKVFLEPAEDVARRLLGKLLVRIEPGGRVLAGRIVETEAYLGANDAASHAFRGKTARNAVMFGPPGRAYVYFTYGMHYCVNAVCAPAGQASAVLIRALEPVLGIERMTELRGLQPGASGKVISGGPARLAQALGITRERDDGKCLTSAASDLQLREDKEDKFVSSGVTASRRIGISRAAELELRFCLNGSECLSRKAK